MNDVKPTFIMMVGLPGSGKSTYAEKIAEESNAIICSSDMIRKELYGDVNSQDKNVVVFLTLHRRIKEHLSNGRNVIYDATNISSKRRRAFLKELERIVCIKKCVIMSTPFEECLEKNKQRDRVIPEDVICKMYKNWNTPYWFEGWNEIKILFNKRQEWRNIEDWVEKYSNYDQNNPHHSMALGEHCKAVESKIGSDKELKYAALLHDCGKPFTKSYLNCKGEETEIAHYYQHHCVGAYESLFYSYPENIDRLYVSTLVNLHMFPYFWENDKKYGVKTMSKWMHIWGVKLWSDVMLMHYADKMSN